MPRKSRSLGIVRAALQCRAVLGLGDAAEYIIVSLGRRSGEGVCGCGNDVYPFLMLGSFRVSRHRCAGECQGGQQQRVQQFAFGCAESGLLVLAKFTLCVLEKLTSFVFITVPYTKLSGITTSAPLTQQDACHLELLFNYNALQ